MINQSSVHQTKQNRPPGGALTKNQVLKIARAQLKAAGDDLMTDIKKSPEFRHEIVVTYLDRVIKILEREKCDVRLSIKAIARLSTEAHDLVTERISEIDQDARQLKLKL